MTLFKYNLDSRKSIPGARQKSDCERKSITGINLAHIEYEM